MHPFSRRWRTPWRRWRSLLPPAASRAAPTAAALATASATAPSCGGRPRSSRRPKRTTSDRAGGWLGRWIAAGHVQARARSRLGAFPAVIRSCTCFATAGSMCSSRVKPEPLNQPLFPPPPRAPAGSEERCDHLEPPRRRSALRCAFLWPRCLSFSPRAFPAGAGRGLRHAPAFSRICRDVFQHSRFPLSAQCVAVVREAMSLFFPVAAPAAARRAGVRARRRAALRPAPARWRRQGLA